MRRSSLALLAVAALLLPGCTRTHVYDTDGPRPGQNVVGLLLNSQKRIRFQDSARVVVSDSAVTVEEANRTIVYPAPTIARVLVEQFHPGIAVMQVLFFVAGNLLSMSVCDEGVEVDFEADGAWSSECADEDDDGFDDDEEDD